MFFSLNTQTFKAHFVKSKCILKALRLLIEAQCYVSFPFFETSTHFLFTSALKNMSRKKGGPYNITALVREFYFYKQVYFNNLFLLLISFLFVDTDDTVHQSESSLLKKEIGSAYQCLNVSTTPITAMGCRQCLPLSVVQLKGKHCRKPHCRNGVIDTFGLCLSRCHKTIIKVRNLKHFYYE